LPGDTIIENKTIHMTNEDMPVKNRKMFYDLKKNKKDYMTVPPKI
jgi:hypothetical protein